MHFCICAVLVSTAQAQLDPERRQLIQFGYYQPIEGRAPFSGYAFYHLNEPGFLQTNLTLRLAVAPVYLDSELGFTGHNGTDWSVGVAGGGFADSYFEMQKGELIDRESFLGHGGEVNFGVYHRVNPTQRIPLSAVGHVAYRYTAYVRESDTSPAFELPEDRGTIPLRLGLRWGGAEPIMFPRLGMELSGWYESQFRTESGDYGFNDRTVESISQLFWGRALFIYTIPKINHNVSLNFTLGTSIDADRFSAYRLGGILPLASEFPLTLPGYYYQEISARRFALFNGQYTLPLDRKERWTITVVGTVAKIGYVPGLSQPSQWQSGVGFGLGFKSPHDTIHTILGYSYGINAVRDHGYGAQSIGLLVQWDLEARHRPNKPLFDIESPKKSRGFFRVFGE